MTRCLLLLRVALALPILCGAANLVVPSRAAADTHRLYDGLTLFVDNPEGRAFDVDLGVRDLNLHENGPREVLFKVTDPRGNVPVREVIPDDGVTSPVTPVARGGFGHESWYYAHLAMQGTTPATRWSAPSQPDRLAVVPVRTFKRTVPAGPGGVWRILLVGATDHYVTVKLDPALKYGASGHCDWLHGHGAQWRRSSLFVPPGALGVHVMLAEFDLPRTRKVTLRGPQGEPLVELATESGTTVKYFPFPEPAALHGRVLTLDVSDGPGDFLVNAKFAFGKDPLVQQRGVRVVPAVFAPDEATAKALHGGAILHDGQVFWQPYQVKLHDWLKTLKEDDFVVRLADGTVVEPVPPAGKPNPKVPSLPARDGFLPLNGVHWRPPLSDRVMHHWPAHRNRAALNVALRDLASGLRSIGPNDHVAVATSGPWGNMAYENGNYAFHFWRPAWRVLRESDAPDEAKQAVREALLVMGDRLAFCRGWERVNGNAYAQIVSALKYCQAATDDPLQQQLFDVYWERFANGGWGDRVGLGPSGPVQEGFAYAYHYGSYILDTWKSVLADLPDPRMQRAYDRIREWYAFTLAAEQIPAGPWSTRTHHYPQWAPETEGPFAWKGHPGPDFTVAVNDANEWFAARRADYYALVYHGRLSPKWASNTHQGQSGYGGGMLCQLHVPGRGPVLASTLNGEYGDGMHPALWRSFHLHSVVGQMVDGSPLVTADAEHPDAKLEGNVASGSGDVRQSAVRCTRSCTFEPDGLRAHVRLAPTPYVEILDVWIKSPKRTQVAAAWEMIPFVGRQLRSPKVPKPGPTLVMLAGPEGKDLGPLGTESTQCRTVTIDRGGFGVRIEFDEPRRVSRGERDTVLIELTTTPKPAGDLSLSYRLVPFRDAE